VFQQRQDIFATGVEQVTCVSHRDLTFLGDKRTHFDHHLLEIFASENHIGCQLFQLSQLDQRCEYIFANFRLTFLDGWRTLWILRKAPHQPLDFSLLAAIEADLVPVNC